MRRRGATRRRGSAGRRCRWGVTSGKQREPHGALRCQRQGWFRAAHAAARRGLRPMNFAFSEEQDELRRAVRRFLAEKSPETEGRRLMGTTEGDDPAVWSQMADQLGLQSLTIPEEFGGSGFSYAELIIVLEEMGNVLLCAPYFSTVALAANALLTSGDDAAKKELLPGLASGETIGTLALTEDNGRWDFDGIGLE